MSEQPKIATADEYVAWRRDYDQKRPSEPQTLPDCGLVFLLRRADRYSHVVTSVLPSTTYGKALTQWKSAGVLPKGQETLAERLGEAATPELEPEEVENSLLEMAQTVIDAVEQPPLAVPDEKGRVPPGYLSAAMLSLKDFKFIYAYAKGIEGNQMITTEEGAVAANSLDKFRKQPARRARTRPDGAKLREAS